MCENSGGRGAKQCVGTYRIFFSRDVTEIKDDSDSYKVELLR